MKDCEYKQEMEEMKKMYDSKEQEIELLTKELDFYKNESVSIYGIIRLLSKSAKYQYLEVDTLMNSLAMIENRLEYVYSCILGEDDID